MCLVVTYESDGVVEIIAMARHDVNPAIDFADVVFVVLDAWQGKGIGTALFRRLSQIAGARGVQGSAGSAP